MCDHTMEESWWLEDARGIPLKRVCEKCIEQEKLRFRPSVIDDPNYESDEPIEPEDY